MTVAHGTRHGPGNDVARRLTSLAGRQLGLTAIASYIELCEPSLESVLAGSSEPTAVVPLLLSSGHHVRHDLPASLAAAPGPVWLGDSLGPHPLLAEAQAARLRVAGALPGRPVVMVAAGSRDPTARPDLDEAARLLSSAWGGPVTLATLSGPGPRPTEVVTPAHAVSLYLLAPGLFATQAGGESAIAHCVGEVLGVHTAVIELVAERAREAAGTFHPTKLPEPDDPTQSGESVSASTRIC